MAGSDGIKSLIIVLLFGCVHLITLLIIGFQKVDENWPEYKCNPAVMPFASLFGKDAIGNFTDCMGDLNLGFMGFFLEPIFSVLNIVAALGKAIAGSLSNLRGMFSFLRFGMFGMFTDLMGVFVNLITRFQIYAITVKSLVMKMIAVIVTKMYKLETAVIFMSSAWKGPIGGVVRAVGSAPF